LTGVYFFGLSLAIAVIALIDGPRFHFAPDSNVSLATLGLGVGIAFATAAGLERSRVLVAMIPLGTLATIVSTVNRVDYNPVQYPTCAIARVNMGFPLPWYFDYNFPVRGCILPLPLLPRWDVVSFFLDVAFYVGVGLTIIQFSRGITGKTIATGSSQVNNLT